MLSRYIALSNKRASVHGDHFPLRQNTASSVYSQRNPIQVASLRDYMTIQVVSFGFTDMFYKSGKSRINSVCARELSGDRQKAGGEKMWMIRDGNTGQARYRASIAPAARLVTLAPRRASCVLRVFLKLTDLVAFNDAQQVKYCFTAFAELI